MGAAFDRIAHTYFCSSLPTHRWLVDADTNHLLLGIYPFLDVLAGSSTVHDVEEEGKGHNVIVHLHGLLVPIVVICLLYRVWDGLGSISLIVPALSAGLATGLAGVVVATNLGIGNLARPVGGLDGLISYAYFISISQLNTTIRITNTGRAKSTLPVHLGGEVSMVTLSELFPDNCEMRTEFGKKIQPFPSSLNLHYLHLLLTGGCHSSLRSSDRPSSPSISLNL